jgi:hypothetical protein
LVTEEEVSATQLIERMREELVRATILPTRFVLICESQEIFINTPASVSIDSVPMIFGDITPCGSWQSAQWCSTWPQSAFYTARP